MSLLLLFMLLPLPCYALDVSASSAILMEQKSHRVLFEKNAHQKMGMASTTKIMTAILAIENVDLNAVATVSANAAGVEGSSMYLSVGEQIKVEDLLYGLMLNSGNDAAIAIAECVGGDVPTFCKMMNEKAREIGAKNTHFTNPNGLADDEHYTTAYDLALISCYALDNEIFAEIVKTKKKSIPWEAKGYNRQLTNHNKLLSLYEGSDGVKTGYTKSTGRTLVSSATRNDFQAVAVTLNAPNDWNDHTNMLDYAFENYAVEEAVGQGRYVKTIPVKNGIEDSVGVRTGENLRLFGKKGEQQPFDTNLILPEEVQAPVYEGDAIGKMQILINGEVCDECDLYLDQTVLTRPRSGYTENCQKIIKIWLQFFRREDIIDTI